MKVGVTWGIPRQRILGMKITIITMIHEVLTGLLWWEDDIGNKEMLASLWKAALLKYAPARDWGSYMTMLKHTDCCLCGFVGMLMWCFPTHHTLTIKHCMLLTTFNGRRTSWKTAALMMQWQCSSLQDCCWRIVWILTWSQWMIVFWRQLHVRALSTTDFRTGPVLQLFKLPHCVKQRNTKYNSVMLSIEQQHQSL